MLNNEGVFNFFMINNDKFHRVSVKGIYSFADDILTSIEFQLKHANQNRNNHLVYIYTIPIIILSINFLESSINTLISLSSKPNNIIKNFKKGLEINKQNANNNVICQKKLLDKYKFVLKIYNYSYIKNDIEYQKIPDIIKLRNAIVHDKLINDEQEALQVLKSFEKYPEFNQEINNGCATSYLNYTLTCWIVNNVFCFYLKYMKLLLDSNDIPYRDKINNIINFISNTSVHDVNFCTENL